MSSRGRKLNDRRATVKGGSRTSAWGSCRAISEGGGLSEVVSLTPKFTISMIDCFKQCAETGSLVYRISSRKRRTEFFQVRAGKQSNGDDALVSHN